MRVLLIRHAQSVNNALYERTGRREDRQPDPVLTPLGTRQAQALADWAARDDVFRQVTHLCSSLMVRAVQTAAPVAEALHLPVQGLPDAYECGGTTSGPAGGFSPLPGGDHAALSSHCPSLRWPERLSNQSWDGGAEPWDHAAFSARARRVVTALHERHSGAAGVIALVTHSDFTQFLLAQVLGHSPATVYDGGTFFQTDHTGTTHLTTTRSGAHVHWVNRTDHLPPDLRSEETRG